MSRNYRAEVTGVECRAFRVRHVHKRHIDFCGGRVPKLPKTLSFVAAGTIFRALSPQIPHLTGESHEQVHPISFSLRVAHRPSYSGRFLAGQVSILHHSVRHPHPRQSVQWRDRALHLRFRLDSPRASASQPITCSGRLLRQSDARADKGQVIQRRPPGMFTAHAL
jgi:hypothetical protein